MIRCTRCGGQVISNHEEYFCLQCSHRYAPVMTAERKPEPEPAAVNPDELPDIPELPDLTGLRSVARGRVVRPWLARHRETILLYARSIGTRNTQALIGLSDGLWYPFARTNGLVKKHVKRK